MWKQNKGRDLEKIAKSKLDEEGPYYISRKYDGHYCQIEYTGNEVTFHTSGGKEFYILGMAQAILYSDLPPFKIECEYLYNCAGLLGDRGKSARLTTYRTEWEKGITTKGHPDRDIFIVLDILLDEPFMNRLKTIDSYFDEWLDWFHVPMHYVGNLQLAKSYAADWVTDGYEGAMCKDVQHRYQEGKRTNDIIKIKPRKTADLLCIGTTDGEGKYEGLIGALILRDREGREVAVGSGLNDYQRGLPDLDFIGKVIEIGYERIDSTYIQPVFKEIRLDKFQSQID